MTRIILQPCSGPISQDHFGNTVRKPVPLETIGNYVSPDQYEVLTGIYPGGEVPTWGVVPGDNNVNVNKWQRVESGDVVLFFGKAGLFASGTVTYRLRNKDLSATLWEYDHKNRTWEYIYFLDDIRYHNIPYAIFNKAAGYKQNAIVYGFNVLNEDKSERIMEAFDLRSEIHLPDISEQQFNNAVNELEGKTSLEAQATVESRIEQSFLRKNLFGKRTVAKCGICNKEFPVSCLVAAHIKKRVACSLEEKKDYKSIVMPMCSFGCDYLYERGYIAVSDGKIIDLRKKPITPTITHYLSQIVGNECSYWNEATAPYFTWHYEINSLSA